jgi:2'-hydroxyisoflavone reductase
MQQNSLESVRSSRRSFLMAAGAGAALAMAGSAIAKPAASPAPTPANRKNLKILILGGTGFLGPAVVDAAKANGHKLTLFNRGRTEKRIGVIEDVEKLNGNRDPKLRADDGDPESPLGLSEIEAAIKGGATWDAVVDTSGYVPRIVKASAELLAPAAQQYVFVSTISVYANNDRPNEDESAAIAATDTPESENVQQLYGQLKALCEQAAEAAMPGKTTNIRPGFIVGPGDPTDRFTYWPVRAAKGVGVSQVSEWGSEMLVPGTEEEPIQFVDVRDLAKFIIHCIEQRHVGAYNVTGPQSGLPVGDFVKACREAGGKDAPTPVWVPWDFIQEVEGPVDTTIVIPGSGETGGFHRRNVGKALAAGLTLRPAVETCKDTIAWWPKEVARRDRVGKQMVEDAKAAGKPAPTLGEPTRLRVGLTPAREKEVLAAFRTKTSKAPETPAKAPGG